MSKINILNSSLAPIGTIEDVFQAARAERINGDNTLSFTAPLTSELSTLVSELNVAELDSDYFDLVYYQKGQASNGDLAVSVECEHVSYRLNNPSYDLEYFTQTGTPTAILTSLLDGTEFTVGVVEPSAEVTYSLQEKMSRRMLLMQFVDYIEAEVEFAGFVVNIRNQRGSAVTKDLLADRNIDVINTTYNAREKDKDGNALITYECSLVKPMAVALGDAVTLSYSALGISASLRVVALTYNPYDPMDVSFEIGNFVPTLADDAYRIETDMLAKGKTYYGARISADYGFESIRSDKMARGVFNADQFALQVGDGSGSNWTDKVYFDPVTGKYIFDGTLSAGTIEAIVGDFDITISQTVITENLYATMGTVAELTVDSLETSDKVARYKATPQNTDRMDFIRIAGKNIDFIEGTVKMEGGNPVVVQLTNKDGQPMYWTDALEEQMFATVTDYPVCVFDYDETIKLQIFYELDTETGYYNPRMVWGAGAGVVGYPERGRGFIEKDADGFKLSYINESGTEYSIVLGETGILFGGYESLSDLDFYTNGFKATYGGHALGYRWTKDGEGKITALEDIFTTDEVAVTWGGGTL